MSLGRCTSCGHVHALELRHCGWCGTDLPAEHRGPELRPPPVEAEAARDYRWATVALAMVGGLALAAIVAPIVDPVVVAIPVMLVCMGGALYTTRKGAASPSDAVTKAALGMVVGVGTTVSAVAGLAMAAFVALYVLCMAF